MDSPYLPPGALPETEPDLRFATLQAQVDVLHEELAVLRAASVLGPEASTGTAGLPSVAKARRHDLLRRRGLLAGVAAVLAGAAAKWTAQPVAAAQTPLLYETTAAGSPINTAGCAVLIRSGPGFNTVPGAYVLTAETLLAGVVGVHGSSTQAFGVYGQSTDSTGVYGQAGPQGGTQAGTWGHSTSGPGTGGDSESGFGLYGVSLSNDGVRGFSTGGVGVRGISSNSNGVWGQGGGANAGVAGFGTSGPGLFGQSNSGAGVFATSTSGTGVYGTSSSGLAGWFVGPVQVNGAFTVVGGPKSAAVPHPDGTHRRLYCVESPESWFEDFGRDRLVNGRGRVRLDPDFAAVVQSDNYDVMLTAEGDHNGLYVSNKTPQGFEVQECRGGTSTVAFSYRVVARRKDVPGPRLERVNVVREAPPLPARAMSAASDAPPIPTPPTPPANAPTPPGTPQPRSGR